MSGLRFKRGYGEMMIGSGNFNMFEDLQKREIIVPKSYFGRPFYCIDNKALSPEDYKKVVKYMQGIGGSDIDKRISEFRYSEVFEVGNNGAVGGSFVLDFSKCEYLAHAISSIYKDEELNVVLYCNGECKFDGCYKNGDVSKTNFSKNRKVLPDISHITDNLNKTNETDFEL